MMRGAILVMAVMTAPFGALADGLLDGRSFGGLIGPAKNPDLEDRLFFDDGRFWSDICTRCGFIPGRYLARKTEDGIAFSGVLESDSRGRFTYDGVVSDSGEIDVTIDWERRRWYWTAERRIVFRGEEVTQSVAADLEATLIRMEGNDPSKNPACARF